MLNSQIIKDILTLKLINSRHKMKYIVFITINYSQNYTNIFNKLAIQQLKSNLREIQIQFTDLSIIGSDIIYFLNYQQTYKQKIRTFWNKFLPLKLRKFIYQIIISLNQKLIMAQFTLGYWGIRGRGQVPRLLLAYTGQKWIDKKYTAPQQWFAQDKQNIGLSFPNLPYLIHGDFKLTQSDAIAKYIIRASGHKQLLGKNIQQEAFIESILGVIHDIHIPVVQLCFSPNFETEKEKLYQEKIKNKLIALHNYIGENTWATGESLTYVDFKISESSYYLEGIWPEHYKQFPSIERIRQAFNNLPQIKAYYESENSVKGPFLPLTAKWH